METLFILLHTHHGWNDGPKEIDWTIGIPVYVAASLFLLNLLREYIVKRRDTKKLLSNHLIETCDKMIRLVTTAEGSILACRFHAHRALLADNDKAKNEEKEYSNYYHRKAEEIIFKYELSKSDLRKNIKDLKNYWGNDEEVRKMISLMSEVVSVAKSEYDTDVFTKEEAEDVTLLYNKYDSIRKNIDYEIMFNGVGFNLARIQKIIDPTSPTLFLSEELEKELVAKINSTK
jgi:hypothetical protein